MTKIQWTEKTWNPTRGCTAVSPGCRNCYAEREANRHREGSYKGLVELRANGRPRWTGTIGFPRERLLDPLRWCKPTMVFVNSMSDLFHEGIHRDYIAAVYAVMACARRHTFQVLTKRPERALEMYQWMTTVFDELGGEEFRHWLVRQARQATSGFHRLLNPLLLPVCDSFEDLFSHVWIGASVENNQCATERIPYLVQIPAHTRFLSAEPLLEALDLSPWIPPLEPERRLQLLVSSRFARQALLGWDDWPWPEWVPDAVRRQIESFWCDGWGRGPAQRLDALYQRAENFGAPPPLGTRHTITTLEGERRSGRFVYCWGNMGRLVHDDGTYTVVSVRPEDGMTRVPPHEPAIHWVIVGGESGPLSRITQCRAEWIFDLVAQTRAGLAAPFVKQLGSLEAKARGCTAPGGDPEEWLNAWPNLRLHPGMALADADRLLPREFPVRKRAKKKKREQMLMGAPA